MDSIEFFKKHKYVHLPQLLNSDVTSLIYNYLILKSCTNVDFSDPLETNDDNYLRYCYADLNTETLLSLLLEKVSTTVQKKLCPTYSYVRVYTKGDELKPHHDRPSCQYSVTINFGGSPWPISFGEFNNQDKNLDDGYNLLNTVTLKPGEGVVYMGEELVHWRNRLEGDHCAQAFLHYIDQDGPYYPEWAYDKRSNIGYKKS